MYIPLRFKQIVRQYNLNVVAPPTNINEPNPNSQFAAANAENSPELYRYLLSSAAPKFSITEIIHDSNSRLSTSTTVLTRSSDQWLYYEDTSSHLPQSKDVSKTEEYVLGFPTLSSLYELFALKIFIDLIIDRRRLDNFVQYEGIREPSVMGHSQRSQQELKNTFLIRPASYKLQCDANE